MTIMGKIDTSGWKEFRVGELFEVKISKSVDKGGLEFAEDGEYDFIGRTPLNNGIQGKLNKLKFEANQEGTYSIAQIGMHVCQYRERKWYASQNLFVLTPFTEKSHKANKFIATVITRYLDCAYGEDTYATYPTVKTLPILKIKLPVDKTGQPDWAYMESYMATLETKVAKSLTLLQAAKDAEKKKVDTREWGSFALGTLFNIVKGKRLTKAEMKSGKTPFIGSSALNNGCTAMIGNDKNQHPENTITVCYNGSVGETFYQDQPYIASDDVNVLYPKFTMNRQIALFIVPLIKGVSSRYDYIDKWKKEAMEADKIHLPVDKNGDPDWDYMEEYMKMVQGKTENMLNQFISA
jgi:hypothetical protein